MKLFYPALTLLTLVNTGVYAAPTNEQLYQMLLEMKTEQESLKKEVAESKIRESDLKAHLDKANVELVATKKQLDESLKDEDEKQKTPNVKEGFFLSAGALYVRPQIDANKALGASKGNNLDYEPGLQVSTGYQAHDNWDYALKYKHTNTDSVVANLPPLIGSQIGTSQIASYKSNYDALDFEIGKQFSPSDHIALRVSGGIRSVALNEHYSLTTTPVNLNYKNDFWGIGPRITAAPSWNPFGNNFRVFGNVGTSFVKGQQHEIGSLTPGINGALSTNNRRLDSFVTMIEAGSGIGYTLKANLVDIDFQAGYQFEHWLVSDQTDNILFRGFHGSYGTVGVKF